MKLWQYIEGSRRGKEAHLVEKESMKDPLLADALEGYENILGNHQRRVAKLQKEITKRQKRINRGKSTPKEHTSFRRWSVAASILIVIGAGAWLLFNNSQPEENDLHTTNRTSTKQERSLAQVPQPVHNAATVTKEDNAPSIQSAPIVQQSAENAVKNSKAIAGNTDTSIQNPAQSVPEAGMEAYNAYIKRNLIRPTDDECRQAKGKVVVELKVGQSGRPYNIRIAQGLCTSANQEAIRLIINGPRWKKGSESDHASVTIEF